jgi:hypothetical protein
MDPVIGRALTVLAGAVCYAVAFIYAKDDPTAFTVLTNAGSFMIGTIVTGAGLTTIAGAKSIAQSTADRVVKSVFPPPPPPV